MTLSELRYLVAVADLRHFGHAAERCHITQSTLSTQLRKLEDFLGVTLFERTSRPVTVTPIGESIVLRARRIIEEVDQICDLARQDEGLLSSTLKLGIIPTLSPYLLPLFLDPLHRAHPQLHILLREDLTANLVEALAAYEVDVLLLALPDDVPGLHAMPLFNEPFWFAFPAGDPLANATSSPSRTWRGAGCCCWRRGIVCATRRSRSAVRRPGKTAGSGCAAGEQPGDHLCDGRSGAWLSLLPALAVQRLTAAGSGVEARPFEAAGAARRIGLLWRTTSPRRDDLVALGKFIQERLPRDVQALGNAAPVVEPVN